MSNLSHEKIADSFEKAIYFIQEKVKARGDLPSASVARQLEILDQLAQFDLGRFLIQHRCGLNGYWTHYLVLPPLKGTTDMEEFILRRMPLVRAMQERFRFFQKALQKELKEGGNYASIPSGVMGDFLLLDYSKLKEFSLTAVDLDPESLQLAENLAKEKGLFSHFRSEMKNAWEWKEKEQYDVIVSNGLNFYEPNNEKVIQLYRIFYQALKPGGLFITSYLTPPPHKVHRCEWKMEQLSFEDLFIQKIIAADLLDAKWQVFRSTEETKTQLEKAGFSEIEFQPDSAGLFPTVLARVK